MGFTVNADPNAPANFTADLSRLLAAGANWIRFGIQAWEIGGWYGDRWYFDDAKVAFFADCVRRARGAGLKISLTLAAMANSPDWTFDQYLSINRLYWTKVAQTVAGAGGVEVLQVYNEHDVSDFRSQAALPGPPTTEYLGRLAVALQAAREISHALLPKALVTTAVTGVTVDDNTEARWYHFFDVVAPSLDIIGMNCYPGTWVEQIEKMPIRLARVRDRYKKQVIITEIGAPTETGGTVSVEAAKTVLPLMMGKAAIAEPLAVLFYQLRNTGTNAGEAEQNFGIYTQDGTPRATRDQVVSAIRPY